MSSETLPFHYWTENNRFQEGSLENFDLIPVQDNCNEDNEPDDDDGSRRNPLRLRRLIRNQRESVAHFVPGRAFLPARNARTVRQQHHRLRAGVPPPSGFYFLSVMRMNLNQLAVVQATNESVIILIE